MDKVLTQLRAMDLDPEPTYNGFAARCPVHQGSRRNFEATVADDGRVLLVCQAYYGSGDDACSQEAVVAALGLEFRDLFPGGPGHGDGRDPGTARQSVRDTVAKPPPTAQEIAKWEAEAAGYEAALSDDLLEELADLLGVDPYALRRLHVGWKASNRRQDGRTGEWVDDGPAWAFPERDAAGRVIGIQRRYLDPALDKKVVHRSHRGLYLPDGWRESPGPVLVPEGASDVAALLTAGRCAVGRPNVGGLELLETLLRDESRDVIIVGENDIKPGDTWPGNPGPLAAALATRLGRPVKHFLPPTGFKDLRAYINHLSAREGDHRVHG